MGYDTNIARRGTGSFSLPPDGPTLVLVGSDNAPVLNRLDRLASEHASTIDVRTNVVWSQVPNGRRFLDRVIAEVRTDRPALLSEVRFGFANPDATIDELVRRALLAPDLAELERLIEATQLIDHPPAFEIRYQPVVNLTSRAVLGFESLIRAEADGVSLDAEELIRRANESDWIRELDSLGRTLALRGTGSWLGQGLLFLNMMAPDGLFDLDAIRATETAAAAAGIDNDQIVLEATERNRYRSLDEVAEQIEEIRSTGMRVAVDDVGDGYSSLSVVAAFKPDIVKLSGNLTRALPSKETEAVIRAVVQMAHSMGSWVVAENIETIDQADHARELGVDWGQGHFFGSPRQKSAGNKQSAHS